MTMGIGDRKFWKQNLSLFSGFKEVHLFGSALYSDTPNDVDILLIYSGGFTPELKRGCDIIRDRVLSHFGIRAHLTILSESEAAETGLARKTNAVQIK